MKADRNGKTMSAITQTAFAKPDVSLSRKRSPRIENSTIRYAMKAKLMTMNQMMSQNDMPVLLSRRAPDCARCQLSAQPGGGASSCADDRGRREATDDGCGRISGGRCWAAARAA